MLYTSEDIQLRLLSGIEIFFDDIPMYSIPLIDIINFGYTKYRQIISLLCMDDEAAKSYFKNSSKNNSTFLLISSLILSEIKSGDSEELTNSIDSIHNLLICFLKLIFKKEVIFDSSYGFIIKSDDGNKILSVNNYNDFRNLLKTRNCIDYIEDEIENPDNEKTRKLLEKRKKLRKKLQQTKANNYDENDEQLNLADLVSIFAKAQHMPPSDVFNKYDIYQFNDQFNRMKIFNDYNINIQALLAGAKSEDIKLQHWLSKIHKNNN